jgi:hypothetical protein
MSYFKNSYIASLLDYFEVRSLLSILLFKFREYQLVSNNWSISHIYLYISIFSYIFVCIALFVPAGFQIGLLCFILILWFLFFRSYLIPFFIPIKSYNNAETDKSLILSENNNKAGVYRWKNQINGNSYIGS